METISAKHFSAMEYLQRLKKANFSEEQAEAVAGIIEEQVQLIQEQNTKLTQLENKELSTKGDVRESELRLQKEIEVVRHEIKSLEVKILYLYGTGFLILLGVLAKGFHWF